MPESPPFSASTSRTVMVTSFVLSLLALIVGFHNVSQRNASDSEINGLIRAHAKTNVASRLTALEADRDALRESVEALKRLVESRQDPAPPEAP